MLVEHNSMSSCPLIGRATWPTMSGGAQVPSPRPRRGRHRGLRYQTHRQKEFLCQPMLL